MPALCRNGDSCSFLRNQRCNFFHPRPYREEPAQEKVEKQENLSGLRARHQQEERALRRKMAGREEQDMKVRLEKEMDEYRKDLVHIAAVTLSKMDANGVTKEYTESKLIEEIEKRLDIKINENS